MAVWRRYRSENHNRPIRGCGIFREDSQSSDSRYIKSRRTYWPTTGLERVYGPYLSFLDTPSVAGTQNAIHVRAIRIAGIYWPTGGEYQPCSFRNQFFSPFRTGYRADG